MALTLIAKSSLIKYKWVDLGISILMDLYKT